MEAYVTAIIYSISFFSKILHFYYITTPNCSTQTLLRPIDNEETEILN
jgi:hypothetical protein